MMATKAESAQPAGVAKPNRPARRIRQALPLLPNLDQFPETGCSRFTALTALVHLRGGTPVTDSPTIAREFGRRHDNVMQTLASLIAGRTINLLDFKEISYREGRGRKQRAIELTERGALIAMSFIGGRNSRAGQVRLIDAFLGLRSAFANHAPSLDPRDDLSTVRDRRQLYHSAIDMMVTRNISLPRAYQAMSFYAGVSSLREMTKRDVVTADSFATRYVDGTTTPHDFERIERNRAALNGDATQLPLLAGE